MNYFVCYDIQENKLRQKLAKFLRRNGLIRVQKSVFFGRDIDMKLKAYLKKEIRQLFADNDNSHNSVLLIPAERDMLKHIEIEGNNHAFREALKNTIALFF